MGCIKALRLRCDVKCLKCKNLFIITIIIIIIIIIIIP